MEGLKGSLWDKWDRHDDRKWGMQLGCWQCNSEHCIHSSSRRLPLLEKRLQFWRAEDCNVENVEALQERGRDFD